MRLGFNRPTFISKTPKECPKCKVLGLVKQKYYPLQGTIMLICQNPDCKHAWREGTA